MRQPVVICIGSNVADKESIVADTAQRIAGLLSDFRASEIYCSPDDSGLGAPYANLVCCGCYEGSLEMLKDISTSMELMAGRTPLSKPSGVMPLDVDIACYAGKPVDSKLITKEYFRAGYALMQSFGSHNTEVCTPR